MMGSSNGRSTRTGLRPGPRRSPGKGTVDNRDAIKLLVISSCTEKKAVRSSLSLCPEDFLKGSAHVQTIERKGTLCAAGGLYTGEQHTRLRIGLEAIARCKPSHTSSFFIVSAGYGLIPAEQKILPYEHTFRKKPKAYVTKWGDFLQIPAAFKVLIGQPYDLGLVFLGREYLQSCRFNEVSTFGGFTIVFCSEPVARKIPSNPNLRVVPLFPLDRPRFGAGDFVIKGEIGKRLLKGLAADPGMLRYLKQPSFDILSWLAL